MAGIANEDAGGESSMEGISSGQHCQSEQALVEWRSSEQVENGTPSTAPLYWDTDDDGGPKPSELYGKYTWKIEKFSQINKRELRSNAFDVGGYKWYILIYPQGCDVCNHLSLFLCVANHDKLLPGWGHFAQFTIAVVNKDPKKSKHSDTLHRFCKKEHDWGWKKFMELSKVLDGFIEDDTLIIKAQVQVIREKAERPFRCLDCEYRRELIRVYLTNVEQICRRFVEGRRGTLGTLLDDKARWSSFCSFWLGIDQNARCRMSREKSDVILKEVVKHFFIEKEVTSTLVMDSLYSGLKALEGQTKNNKGSARFLDGEEIPAPIVRVEKDSFVLVDDVLLLLERAAMEPLPPKDEKGPQNRTKEGNSGEDCNKDSIEADARRLTELGRRTVEIYILAHIFSYKIEIAYQEAVALKRQEELIREEEAACLAENEQKAKRGATEKEKKLKKKQAKQRRNNRKLKDKEREERPSVPVEDKPEQENPGEEKKDFIMEQVKPVIESPATLDDVSDASDSVDCAADVNQLDLEDRDGPVNWDTDASEIHPPLEASSSGISSLSSIQNGIAEKRNPSVMDDSSSTCSTDSVPSVVMNGPYKGNSFPNYKIQKSPSRGKNHRCRVTCDESSLANETNNQLRERAVEAGDLNDISGNNRAVESESEAVVNSLQDQIKWLEHRTVKKEEEAVSLQKKLGTKDPADVERPKEKTAVVPLVVLSPRGPPGNIPSNVPLKSEYKSTVTADPVPVGKTSSNGPQQTDKAAPSTTSSQMLSTSKPDTQNTTTPKSTEKSLVRQVPVMSRPSSAPLIPGPRPTAPVVSMVQTAQILARSVSAAGRLGPDPSPASHSYVPQSYRNAIMGTSVASSSASLTHANTQPPAMVSTPIFVPQISERIDPNSVKSGFPFGMLTRDVLQSGPQWVENSCRDSCRSMQGNPSSLINDVNNFDLYKPAHNGSREHLSTESPACTSGRQSQGGFADEFPHLDIINDLLDEEHGIGKSSRASTVFQSLSNGPHLLNRQFSYPGEMSIPDDLGSSSSSCRFERTRSYHGDTFQQGYSSMGSHFDLVREFVPQASPVPYANGHFEGLITNQWQVAGPDLSLLSTMNTEGDGYPYYFPELTNLACGVNGYTVYRPSNEH